MANPEAYDYGLWQVVAANAALLTTFAAAFTRPRTWRDWRSLGAFSAFVVALFTEMYGFPFTIYLLSGWLGASLPGVERYTHEAGHLWATLLGWKGDPHFTPIHVAADGMILSGMALVAAAWLPLFRAQQRGLVATSGPYRLVRHPQYVGFAAVLLGFLVQWPTLPTAIMFPVLVGMYYRLAKREEAEAAARFGEAYATYAKTTGAFIPRLRSVSSGNAGLRPTPGPAAGSGPTPGRG